MGKCVLVSEKMVVLVVVVLFVEMLFILTKIQTESLRGQIR